MQKKKYWKGLDELNNTPEFVQRKKSEFAEKLPTEPLQQIAKQSGDRRDFLKMMGFGLGAATLAAGCEIPVRKAIPYVIKPEEILPSVANYYASTFFDGSYFCNVLVKTREGRPIKIEGNPQSPITKGGTSAQAQASVVTLYDNKRLKGPIAKGADTTWQELDNAVARGISGSRGDVVMLTAPIMSPSTQSLIGQMQSRYPNFRVVTYEPVSQSGMLLANEESFGLKAIPSYHFDKAEVIVSVDCDFLGSWISPIEFSGDYIKTRKVDVNNPVMSQHFQFEPSVSITGAKADYRRSVKPSETGAVLVEIFKQLGGGVGASGATFDPLTTATIKKAVASLRGAKGKSLVVCGSNDKDAQVVTNAINSLLNNMGNTIDFGTTYNNYQGTDKEMAQLVSDMNAGRVGAILINNVNPLYSYPEADKFSAGLGKVGTKVSFNAKADETSVKMDYLAPDHHYLESWNDLEIKTGQYSIVQPTIAPLFKTRSLGDSLMRFAGVQGEYADYIRQFWGANGLESEDAWVTAVHDGVFGNTRGGSGTAVGFSGNASSAASKLSAKVKKGGAYELCLYENNTIGDGRFTDNPFLQETPDPISRICWENYAVVNPELAKEMGWTDVTLSPTGHNDLIKITANGKSIEVPITIQPGQRKNVVSVALGYGRTGMGHEETELGANAYPLAAFDGNCFDRSAYDVSIEGVSKGHIVAQVQTYHTIDDNREIINETTLADYKENPLSGNYTGQKYSDEAWVDHHFVSLYPQHEETLKMGHHWGMSIDLNSCTGCAACVVSCHIENNVPVVGKDQVRRGHDMHWLRIDRYYATNEENDPSFEHPEVAFMPMMCQHCDNAPCENVCPVNASNHSSEGLNQMAYNRCIGTRYCANNCPFKVRRFNWFDYQGADSWFWFKNDHTVMVDNLSRMVLNPDVTVRSRGVMEKCSFCVQKIQDGKLTAKKEKRKLKDGEIVTACQAACTTGAISFGDVNDSQSEVVANKADARSYALLADIHVLPSVTYKTIVKNKESVEGYWPNRKHRKLEHHGGDHGDGHGGHGDGHGGHGGDHNHGGDANHDNHGHDGHGHDDHSHGDKNDHH